ncbi:MAG: GntR family transcriptional regulator [Olsenella sp.]
MPKLEKRAGSLLYVQVSDYVREKIYSKEWGVDAPIPSEHELMGMLGLSRGTVQKGIRKLVDEGLLVQQRGRGTFVTQPLIARPSSNRLLSFAESMSAQGIEFETRVVDERVEPANLVCAENLGIEEGEDYLYLARVRYAYHHPVMFIESHLNLRACPGIEDADFSREGLFAAAERTSGQGIGRSEMAYSARTAGKRRGQWLECDEARPSSTSTSSCASPTGRPSSGAASGCRPTAASSPARPSARGSARGRRGRRVGSEECAPAGAGRASRSPRVAMMSGVI